jgi:hypothetical protein
MRPSSETTHLSALLFLRLRAVVFTNNSTMAQWHNGTMAQWHNALVLVLGMIVGFWDLGHCLPLA